MGKLYLIRHGQANFGGSDYDLLSAHGKHQAHALGRYFKANNESFDLLIAGAKRRQQETAVGVAHELGLDHSLEIIPAFNEFDAEGLLRASIPLLADKHPSLLDLIRVEPASISYETFRHAMTIAIEHWVDGSIHLPDHIESWPTFKERVWSSITRLCDSANKGKRLAVFTSGGPISLALHMLANGEAGLNWEVSNTSVTVICFESDRLVLEAQPCLTPHLNPDEITYI